MVITLRLVPFVFLLVAQGALAEKYEDDLSLQVPGKIIRLSKDHWEKMEDPTNFAKNYLQKGEDQIHKHARVVTVYLIPMSEDRKGGFNITRNEYLEFFIVHRGFVTAQTKIDKGKYWVLCRETFQAPNYSPVDIQKYRPFLSEDENRQLWATYQQEIDETRYLLQTLF